jgi:hypothetical protein
MKICPQGLLLGAAKPDKYPFIPDKKPIKIGMQKQRFLRAAVKTRL